MRVTRDVITDLWPVYESGEASPDTRAVVEAFLSGDAEFARRLRDPRPAALPRTPSLPPDHEKRALAATQALLRRGQWLLGLALFFTFLPGWTVQTERIRWTLWQDLPAVAVMSGLIAAASWTAYVANRRRLRIKGF